MGFAVLGHSEIDCFQRRIIVSSQVQEVLWLDITDEHIAGMTLRHCPQNVTHRLGSVCTWGSYIRCCLQRAARAEHS